MVGHSAYLNIQTTYGGVAYELAESTNQAYYSAVISFLRWMSGWVYGFHMPLFFMLSGAVLAIKPLASMDEIVRSKIRHLLIPYFVYGWLFMLPIKRMGNFYTNDTLKQALKGFLSGEDSGHLWFLTALFWVIIVFATLKKILTRFHVESIYALLFVCGVIKLTYGYLPFDILGLKTGLSYIFWFALGYVFECERERNVKWNIKKMIFALLIIIALEQANKKYSILDSFFVIVVGSFLTYIVADILNRCFPNALKLKGWKIVTRNLFYIYLFHDPMEYLVLRIFINRRFLDSAIGCYSYTFARIAGIILVSIALGEIVNLSKRKILKVLN